MTFLQQWTNEQIEHAMLDHVFAHGAWPTPDQWRLSAPHHPSAAAICKRYGTWTAAKRAAGWNGRAPGAAA